MSSDHTSIVRIDRLSMGGMTWDDIVRDRAERFGPAPAVRLVCSNEMVKPDARLPSNLAAHIERTAPIGSMTKPQIAKFRKATMKACPCRLCALALAPPATFADVERFGLASIEVESVGLWEVSNTSRAAIAQHEEDRAIERYVSQGMTTAEAFLQLANEAGR